MNKLIVNNLGHKNKYKKIYNKRQTSLLEFIYILDDYNPLLNIKNELFFNNMVTRNKNKLDSSDNLLVNETKDPNAMKQN